MSIPKVIHYCWFGGNELPSLAKKCIKSWEKYCPGYKIVRWDETNCDFDSCDYVKEAFEAKKWAFVSDYIRLKTVYENGGIYLDTDVEIIKPLDSLTELGGFMGFDEKGIVATGLGFGAEKGNAVVREMMKDYENAHFLKPDGTYDLTPCPDRNTSTLQRLGMDTQKTSQTFMDMTFLPRDYLCPMDYTTGRIHITQNTYSIHRYCASWTSAAARRTKFVKRIIGVRLYEKLYGKFLHKLKWLEW